ncbi:MAG TPA: sugar phosphate nucleotidyltransferase, partial [Candidatus Angelobacter sp.]|nr:sugar phosphate nucleotidyltransferase [Candidatus Angelobacter sp.]
MGWFVGFNFGPFRSRPLHKDERRVAETEQTRRRTPQHMLPIANKPMLMYGFDQLRASSVKEIGVILGPLQEGIVQVLGDGSKFGVKITYIEQSDPRGIAHAVMISRKFLGESPFIVHLGDNLLKDNVPKLAQEFLRSEADASVILTRVRDPERFGVVELKNSKIVRLVEKPKQY